ncbi:MAG: transcription-repair coupling factor [Chloroflexi bacterium]|nr:transcription-repair coupling factor [Chloroflexota bacterium]
MDLSALLTLIDETARLGRLREALRPSGRGTSARAVAGINDAAKPAALAALVADEERPVLILTGRPARAEVLAEELAAWLGPSAGDAKRVLFFPERDALPYERLAPARETVRDRLNAVIALAEERPCVIVASALALAQRTLSPDDLTRSVLDLRPGQRLEMEAFLRELARLGYTMEPLVQEASEASRRGGIVDVFPPTAQAPLRIEFFGDEIESIRTFSASTQRTSRSVEEARIVPAQELLPSEADDWLAPLSKLGLKKMPDEARERIEEELTLLRDGASFKERDFYVQFLAPCSLLDHLPAGALLVVDEEADVQTAIEEAEAQGEATRKELEAAGEIPYGLPPTLEAWPEVRRQIQATGRVLTLARWAMPTDGETSAEEGDAILLPFVGSGAYAGQLRKLATEVAQGVRSGRRFVIVSQQAERLAELLEEEDAHATVGGDLVSPPPNLSLVQGSLQNGWKLGTAGELTLLTDSEVFGFVKQRRAPPKKAVNREAFLADLTQGAYVVHIDHGIGRFAGLIRRTTDGNEREYLELHYAEGDRLFVPTDQLDRVSRYIGPSDKQPTPTRLGAGDWQRAKQRARRAVAALAKDLLQLYASREVMPGYAYPPDSAWQAELDASFPYVETPDQLAAISAVKHDMESPRPMDRLVCGDVGYGKTEVALRAAFKAVMDGRQVAVLVPTTVLAQQHFNTFRERLAAFPVRIEVLSRLRSHAEQKRIVESLQQGTTDIVIGTHRLLQKDIRFQELGLVVIDEEQRFGVANKEFLKEMRREVDVLTLSATPIPRTLYMALGGIRDMSTMETPPEERLPIKTYVSQTDDRLIREAIARELERGGQVYFVHNRVHSIEMIAGKLRDLVPEARIGIGHGQMDERELARTMEDFTHGRTDVLVCTTIIESGLDIPNVNTIIINQADRLGLAQLYQLRGRVGRGAHRAYAYLLYEKNKRLTETAKARLQTIFEATELGAGFQIAQRDLEIRGAGNLLGAEQSGYMAAIGFDLYIKLLSGAVERMRALMRGETPPPEREGVEVSIDLPLSAHLPPSYVPDLNLRLAVYQRLSAAEDPAAVETIGQEMVDRFGEPPPLAHNLLYVVTLRSLAKLGGVQSIIAEGATAVVKMEAGETLPTAALEETAPRGVQVGRTMMHVELDEGWRDRLRQALELLVAARAEESAENADAAPVDTN